MLEVVEVPEPGYCGVLVCTIAPVKQIVAIDNGGSVPMHSHSCPVDIYYLRGSATLDRGAQRVAVRGGQEARPLRLGAHAEYSFIDAQGKFVYEVWPVHPHSTGSLGTPG